MPVGYYVRENKLTTPPSYYCQTTAEEVLGYDEISELIHTLNPSITAAQANTVLQNLHQVVTEQVADGKSRRLG
uniref:DNA-binding domain-containing protein n=1 Tax=Candidatus Electrothrix sp. TaxID=2170559 RepID=UPI0040567718